MIGPVVQVDVAAVVLIAVALVGLSCSGAVLLAEWGDAVRDLQRALDLGQRAREGARESVAGDAAVLSPLP